MLFQDIRYGIRTLVGNPGFTLTAVLCLSLGIGLNGSIFSIVDGVLLKPFRYPDADRIVILNAVNQRAGITRTGLSWLDLRDVRDQSTTIAAAAAFSQRTLSISDGRSDPERYNGVAVSAGLFNLLGTPPALGRDFGPDDDRAGAERVVMLSDEVWTLRYNGDGAIIGRAISINGFPHTVIGVMPPGFMFPETQRLWVALAPYFETTARDVRALQVFARLRPGVSIEQAKADLDGIAARLASTHPNENENWSAAIRPLREWMIPEEAELTILSMMGAVTLVTPATGSRLSDASLPVFGVRTLEELRQLSVWRYRLFGWMFSAFGAVALLLASVGVYGVLSYAVTQRRQEIGVRVALGAARRDVLALVVGHGLRLAAVGIVVGIAGAFAVTRLVKTLLYNVTPSDPLSFGLVAAFLVAVATVASYVPARRAMGVDPIIVLRNE